METHMFTEKMPLVAVARVHCDDPYLFFRMVADEDARVDLTDGEGFEPLSRYIVGTDETMTLYGIPLDWSECISEERWNEYHMDNWSDSEDGHFSRQASPIGSRRYVVRFAGRIHKWEFQTDVIDNCDYHDPKAFGKQEAKWETAVRKRNEIKSAYNREHTRWIGTSFGTLADEPLPTSGSLPRSTPPEPVSKRWCTIA